MILPSKLIAQCDGIPITYNLLKKDAKWVQQENLNYYEPIVQYIGYPKDSIYIGINSNVNEELVEHRIDKKFRINNNIRNLSEAKFSIKVCNTNIIKMSFRFEDLKPFDQNILNCYSVIIKNIDSFPIDISIRKIIPLALETEEQNGTWKSIIEEYRYECTTGDAHYFIKPNEIAIVAVPIIPNNKKHRFRIGKTYSNNFYQKLN
jgi:hypothetical protein